jgi:hypothetical protein
MYYPYGLDTAEYTLFRSLNCDGLREELRAHLGRSPTAENVLEILCGPVFEDLPVHHQEMQVALWDIEEIFRIFCKMAVEILTLEI